MGKLIDFLRKWKVKHIIEFVVVLGLGFGMGHIISDPEASKLKDLETQNNLANQKIGELQKQWVNI